MHHHLSWQEELFMHFIAQVTGGCHTGKTEVCVFGKSHVLRDHMLTLLNSLQVCIVWNYIYTTLYIYHRCVECETLPVTLITLLNFGWFASFLPQFRWFSKLSDNPWIDLNGRYRGICPLLPTGRQKYQNHSPFLEKWPCHYYYYYFTFLFPLFTFCYHSLAQRIHEFKLFLLERPFIWGVSLIKRYNNNNIGKGSGTKESY